LDYGPRVVNQGGKLAHVVVAKTGWVVVKNRRLGKAGRWRKVLLLLILVGTAIIPIHGGLVEGMVSSGEGWLSVHVGTLGIHGYIPQNGLVVWVEYARDLTNEKSSTLRYLRNSNCRVGDEQKRWRWLAEDKSDRRGFECHL
jgi:hypothetical protein